jgi:mono/diheme cytochrome c family protein
MVVLRVFGIIGLLASFSLWAATAQADYLSGIKAYNEKDYPIALKELRPFAETGDGMAQAMMGMMFEYGQGVARDERTSLYWFQRAAEQGLLEAQELVGVFYFAGKGTPRDLVKALAWWQVAADGGSRKAADSRSQLMAIMTAAQVTEAARLAQMLKPKTLSGRSYSFDQLAGVLGPLRDKPGGADIPLAAQAPVSGGLMSAARGKVLFEGKGICFNCHGVGGRGDGKAGQMLNPKPTDLTNASALRFNTDRQKYQAIRSGIPGTGMLPTTHLSEDELWALVEYLKELPLK